MTSRSDAIARLEAQGRSDAPPLDGDTVERIGGRLTTQIEGTTDRAARTDPDGRARRTTMRSVAAMAAAAALILIALLISEPDSATLELVAAQDVMLELADGTTRSAIPGEELADGTIVTVGPDGRAVIGDIRLGPGAVARIEAGHVVPIDPTRALRPARTESGAGVTAKQRASTVPPSTAVGEPLRPDAAPDADAPPPTRPAPTTTLPRVVAPRTEAVRPPPSTTPPTPPTSTATTSDTTRPEGPSTTLARARASTTTTSNAGR